MGHLISCVVILIVILFIAPLFQALPTSVLGSIIIVALFPLFKQFKDLALFWKVSKVDFFVWLVTWFFTCATDVAYGLAIGLFFVLFATVAQTMWTKGYPKGTVGASDLYVQASSYSKVKPMDEVTVFYFESSLYYATVPNFKKQLFAATVNPVELMNKAKTQSKEEDKENEEDKKPDFKQNLTGSMENVAEDGPAVNGTDMVKTGTSSKESPIETIILDCSSFTFLDVMGMNTLMDLFNDYKTAGITLVLAACGPSIRERLTAAGLIETGPIPIYPTVQDAMFRAKHSHTADTNV